MGSAPHESHPDGPLFHVTRRSGRSVRMFMLQKLLRPWRSKMLSIIPDTPAGSSRLTPPKGASKRCEISERRVDDIWIYDFTPKPSALAKLDAAGLTPDVSKANDGRKKRIYYFCGGGWQMPPTAQHYFLCAQIASRLPNATLSLISYPLAPNSPAPDSFPRLAALYTNLLAASRAADETVILAGDSAGGNIALCLPLAALAENPAAPVPAAILAISPSVDLRRGNPAIPAVERHDPLLTIPFINASARAWAGDWDAFDPRVSPLAADLSPLAARGVAVNGIAGTYDVLCPDAGLFRDKCQEAGVRGEWLEWERQMHCWVLTARYHFPEGKQGVDWIVDVLARV